MDPYKEIHRGAGAGAMAPPRGAIQMHQSPQAEFTGFESDPGDPAQEPTAWHPLGWVANKATSAAEVLRHAGNRILQATDDAALSLATSLGGTFERLGYPEGVPPPEISAQMVTRVVEKLPEHVRETFGLQQGDDIAGYITLADGRKIPVPKAKNPQGAGERAMTDVALAAIRKANVDDAYNRGRLRLQERGQELSAEEWAQTFALQQRAAGLKERLGDLQARALELAIEKETSSPAQRALWGRPSTIDPSKEPPHRKILAIGSGLPGGVLFG